MTPRTPRIALAALAAGACLAFAAGCGGDDEQAGTTAPAPATQTVPQTGTAPDGGQPTASIPQAPPPPDDVTTLPPERVDPAEPAPPEQPTEEPVRVPATFTVVAGRLTPPQITVPPFLAIEVSVVSDDGRAHEVVVQAQRPVTIRVAAGRRAVVRVPGQRAGRYAIELDGREAGALDVGGEVGP